MIIKIFYVKSELNEIIDVFVNTNDYRLYVENENNTLHSPDLGTLFEPNCKEIFKIINNNINGFTFINYSIGKINYCGMLDDEILPEIIKDVINYNPFLLRKNKLKKIIK